ncbi:MAG: hypothetical protein PHI73_03440 [Patescibacteria group bacterium]|nr:hypothetical protein [Patescibacteria group bacterium]
MRKKATFIALFLMLVLILSGCGQKKKSTDNVNTNNANTNSNTNAIGGEAPFTMSGNTKVFTLKLVNDRFNYTTMTFYAGDIVRVTLASDDQPVDFEFKGTGAVSTSGTFSTSINNTDPGGTYQLTCKDRECGSITVNVVNLNPASANTNTNASTTGITRVELQRLPAGTTFSPNVNMEVTNTFEVGDLYGIGVIGNFTANDKYSRAIVDSAGNVVEAVGPESQLQAGNSTNGSCCFSLPSTPGEYSMKIYLNGVEAQSVPITVSE